MVKSTSPRMLQREWSTYYSTCSLMSGSEARCCWVHIIPLAYSRNPRDAQAKICRKRPDKMKLSETLVAYLVEQLGARALPPATTNSDAPSDVARHGRRTSPGRHPSQSRPTPARPRPLKSRPAPAGAGGRSASFSRESRPRRHAPRAENTPSLRPGRGTSNPSLPADLCLSDREMRTPPAPRMFLRGRCLARRFCSKLLLKSRYRK